MFTVRQICFTLALATVSIAPAFAAKPGSKPSDQKSNSLLESIEDRADQIIIIGEGTIGFENLDVSELGFLLEFSGIRVNTGGFPLGKASNEADELAILLEVSGIRVNTKNVTSEMAPNEVEFLLEFSGLANRSFERSDAIILALAAELGFTATDDLASLMAMVAGAKRPWTSEEIAGFIMY